MRCARCGERGDVFLPYLGKSLCNSCFLDLTERRVEQRLRKLVKKEDKLLLLVSANAPSSISLFLIQKILGRVAEINFAALAIDQGIEGYSKEMVERIRKTASNLGIEFYSRKASSGKDCIGCRKERLRAAKRFARDRGFNKLLECRELDRSCVLVLRKLLGDSIPSTDSPISSLPMEEVENYARIRGIKFWKEPCPRKEKIEKGIDRLLKRISKARPGARFSLRKIWMELDEAHWEG
jgi:tRNA(Ile)-lysidine synthase TilS/MesJ